MQLDTRVLLVGMDDSAQARKVECPVRGGGGISRRGGPLDAAALAAAHEEQRQFHRVAEVEYSCVPDGMRVVVAM